MDNTPTILLSLVFVIWICIHFLRSTRKLPPGPYPYPIIGNILQLSGIFHESLAKFSEIYGPLMTIKLGSKTTIVVSSREMAKEILQKHENALTRRLVTDAASALDHHKHSVLWLPTLSQWRNFRKLCKEQIFSWERLNASQGIRQEKVQQLCSYLHECCIIGKAVNISDAAFTTSLNLISKTLFSIDFAGYDSNSSVEIKEIVSGLMKAFGAPNVVDSLPILRVMDPQGIRRQAKFYLEKLLEVLDGIINQRLQERRSSLTYSRRNDFLETLLDLNEQNGENWSYKDIKHLLLDLFSAGTETTSATVEWVMTELLRNPGKREKAKAEIQEVIGQSKDVQESDISKLPYLQALVKETFRLHPVATLLARQPEDDIEINKYTVPKNSQILVNIWAICRDPGFWLEPESFIPERFLDTEIDVKGQHFELLTFGTGRRICLGMSLAHRMLHLIIASLLHHFDWKLEDGIKPEDIDMSEKFGATVKKAVPLKAIPVLINT
ncbi:hypothetical protein ACH5RR_023951 [Cinchona calisaya]|uniref:Cytochrome P450 n=1 Tax=Cinchona calisaya TaxID=153742 RepID=A0ABD2ZC42_9GENT